MSPTVRDLLKRYDEKKEAAENPAEAMLNACDEMLVEMDEEDGRGTVVVSIEDSWVDEHDYVHLEVLAPRSHYEDKGVPTESAILEVLRPVDYNKASPSSAETVECPNCGATNEVGCVEHQGVCHDCREEIGPSSTETDRSGGQS